MKKLILTSMLILTIPLAAGAQQQTVDPGQMQQILQQVQQHNKDGRISINTNMIIAALGIHACLKEKIGDEGMKRVGAMGNALNKQVKPLCAAGKRDEAMALQVEYANQMMKSPEYAGMRSCADQYKESLNDPSLADLRAVVENPAQTDKHICDYQKPPAATPIAAQ